MLRFLHDCWTNNRRAFWRWALELYIAGAVTLLLILGK